MFANIKSWWNDPYDPNMSAVGWFAFIGLLIAALMIWRVVIAELSDWN